MLVIKIEKINKLFIESDNYDVVGKRYLTTTIYQPRLKITSIIYNSK